MTTGTQYCAHCGARHGASRRCCGACGSPLPEAAARRHMLRAADAQRRSARARRIALGLLLACLVVAFVVALRPR